MSCLRIMGDLSAAHFHPGLNFFAYLNRMIPGCVLPRRGRYKPDRPRCTPGPWPDGEFGDGPILMLVLADSLGGGLQSFEEFLETPWIRAIPMPKQTGEPRDFRGTG